MGVKRPRKKRLEEVALGKKRSEIVAPEVG